MHTSTLSGRCIHFFVGYYERKIPDDQWPEMYERYVDDIFSHFYDRHACDRFFALLNELHPALRFTREDEENHSLPFMDVRVSRKAEEMVTSVYRKPTFTGLYTPWDSFSPTRYKINTVRALAHRVLRICSPPCIDDELQNLRQIFLRNGYPGSVLDTYITSVQRPHFIGPGKCPLVIHLPWLGHNVATCCERRIRTTLCRVYFAVKVRFAYTTNRAFSLPKDRLPTPLLSNVIYTFECRQCASRYVGRTSQHLIDRIKQHVPRYLLPSSKSKLRKPDREYQSAIARHLAGSEECRRQAYSDADFTILARSRSSHHLQVLEATYIFTLKPALCLQKSFVTPLQIFTEKKNALSSSLHPT